MRRIGGDGRDEIQLQPGFASSHSTSRGEVEWERPWFLSPKDKFIGTGGKSIAVSYNDSDLERKESKALPRASAGGNIPRFVRENNLPWCFGDEAE